MTKQYIVTVEGKEKTWSFQIAGKDEYLKDWREDGLEVDELLNTIPEFVVWLGLTRLWCWLQDRRIIGL